MHSKSCFHMHSGTFSGGQNWNSPRSPFNSRNIQTLLNTPDHELATAIRNGDEVSFEAMFRHWYPRLCGFAGRFLPDRDAAEEVVQDMFCSLWEKRVDFKPTSSLNAYLFSAVRNRCLNQLQHQKVRQDKQEAIGTRLEEQGRGLHPDELLEGRELKLRIEEAVAELPERCKEVFQLSRYEGKKYKEIATEMGISPRTVEVQIGKALKHLRGALRDILPFLLWMIMWWGEKK